MQIAVASQNKRDIFSHAGRARRFWIFQVEAGAITSKHLLELSKEECFHEAPHGEPHPLDGVDVLIAGGMGAGLLRRLERRGIRGIVTPETDPETAASLFLAGELPTEAAHAHGHGH